jgi:hypothetical protein
MANDVEGQRTFRAVLELERKEISSLSLASVLLRYPLQTVTTLVAIHWQALRLWIKRCPIYEHPDKQTVLVEKS